MNNYLRTAAFAAILSYLIPSIAAAENQSDFSSKDRDKEAPLTHIVITANRYPTTIDQVGSSISLIDQEKIEKKNQATVLEVLRTTPGLEVVQVGGVGRTASIFIRGADSDHTLVLIDGVRVNDNTTGQFDFANLKAENIERIEILRGPQSVLYGSEAIGGLINIITKTGAQGLHASSSAEGGSHGTQHYKGNLSWASKQVHTSTTLSYLRTDGISAAAANRGNTEKDAHDNFSVSNRSGLGFLDNGKADLSLRYSSATTEVDGFSFGIGAVDDPNFEQDTNSLSASFTLSKNLTDSIIPNIELGFTDIDLKGSDPDTDFNNFDIDDQTQSFTSKVDFLMPWDGVISLGYSFEYRASENKDNFDEKRDINSFFVLKQYSWNDKLFLTGGVRSDKDSDFGEEVTYRITSAYLLKETGTRLHASYGTGFKSPSFNELFFPNFGNPNLDAETSWAYDIGVEQTLANGKAVADISFFLNSIDNLISFDSTTFLAENIEEAEIKGVESTLSLALADWLDSSLAYTYTDSENKTVGGILARRPRHRGALELFAAPIENLETSLSFVLVNSRRESDRSKMDNYEIVNIAASYAASKHIKPFLRIDNVFDESYEEVNGFGTAGFSVYAGIEGGL